MADANAQADIRGIFIDTIAKGYAEEQNVFKKFITVSPTSAREIRWYSKTSGFLDTVDTTGITTSNIANISFKARPFVVEQSWTRNTSYVRKYMVESPWLSDEDIKDSDVDILTTNIRDLVRAVERQVDSRIYTVLAAAGCGTAASTQDGWDDSATGNPILDLLNAKQSIRSYGYDPEGAVLAINSIEHKNLINFLIAVKGASIPAFASQKIETGVVMEILGLKVVVSENAPTDEALIFTKDAATWKEFVPITAVTIEDKGIGTKIRVWEEGECIRTDPYAVFRITDTVV